MVGYSTQITEGLVTAGGHVTHYLTAGPEHGPLIIFLHGWPELSLSWRHQLPVLAGLGFRAVAPDMRGYGKSTNYSTHEDYAQEKIVADMLALLDGLGRHSAVWVGHDWGCVTVWSIASHHPQRCIGVANLCVPYYTLERGLTACLPLINRSTYPEAEYPAGQWEYQLFYEENFDEATGVFNANPYNTVKALFRKGDPDGFGKPAATAMTRIQGGWFPGLREAPDLPRDADVVSADDLSVYAESLTRNGFFGPDSYYMNHRANADFALSAGNDGYLDMPVLFLGARYDYVCETVNSALAAPMRQRCRVLDEKVINSGHWMAQERPADVNAALVEWLSRRLHHCWPVPATASSGGV